MSEQITDQAWLNAYKKKIVIQWNYPLAAATGLQRFRGLEMFVTEEEALAAQAEIDGEFQVTPDEARELFTVLDLEHLYENDAEDKNMAGILSNWLKSRAKRGAS